MLKCHLSEGVVYFYQEGYKAPLVATWEKSQLTVYKDVPEMGVFRAIDLPYIHNYEGNLVVVETKEGFWPAVKADWSPCQICPERKLCDITWGDPGCRVIHDLW